jgi:hypothetical protein
MVLSSVPRLGSLKDAAETPGTLSDKSNAIRGLVGHQRMTLRALRSGHYLHTLAANLSLVSGRLKSDLQSEEGVLCESYQPKSPACPDSLPSDRHSYVPEAAHDQWNLVTVVALMIIMAVSGRKCTFIPNGRFSQIRRRFSNIRTTAGYRPHRAIFQSLGRNGRLRNMSPAERQDVRFG